MDNYMFKTYLNKHKNRNKYRQQDTFSDTEREKLFKMMLENDTYEDTFTAEEAIYIVSQMYHLCDGKRDVGEHYSITKAKEVYEKYKGIIPNNNTCIDVYIAINAQYHDYCELFKAWFGENIDIKVFESAVNFWFKDEDYKTENKVYKYFNEV